MRLRKDPTCPACGTREITQLIDYEQFCGTGAAAYDTDELPELTPRQVDAKRARGDDFVLLDVREPYEWAVARIEGARLVPLAALHGAIGSLDPAREIVVLCKMGGRSANAVRQLRAAGFRKVSNLAGGILRWSDDVDPTIPKY